MRLRFVVESGHLIPTAERAALLRADTPMSDSTKARRKRGRARMRNEMKKSVGGVLALPRLRWLLASGAVAAAVPFTFGVPGTPENRMPPGAPTLAQPIESSDAAVAHLGTGPLPSPITGGTGATADTGQAGPTGRVYRQRVSVDVPGVGPAGAGSFEPAPEEGTKALTCVYELRVVDDVCVPHPFRE